MAADTTPLPFRHDTLLGVCEGLGRETGISPTIFRIVFAMLLLWNPEVVVATYLGLGLVLALVRWLMPDVRAEAQAATEDADDAAHDLPMAA